MAAHEGASAAKPVHGPEAGQEGFEGFSRREHPSSSGVSTSWKERIQHKLALKRLGLGRTASGEAKEEPEPANVIVGPVIGKVGG
jgi:hypothetical protein